MSDSLKIFCENTGEYVDIRGGETLLDICLLYTSDAADEL